MLALGSTFVSIKKNKKNHISRQVTLLSEKMQTQDITKVSFS